MINHPDWRGPPQMQLLPNVDWFTGWGTLASLSLLAQCPNLINHLDFHWAAVTTLNVGWFRWAWTYWMGQQHCCPSLRCAVQLASSNSEVLPTITYISSGAPRAWTLAATKVIKDMNPRWGENRQQLGVVLVEGTQLKLNNQLQKQSDMTMQLHSFNHFIDTVVFFHSENFC